MNKKYFTTLLLSTLLPLSAYAGETHSAKDKVVCYESPCSPWDNAIRPISNPTLFDLPIPRTYVHGIAIYNQMPDLVNTIIGNVPVGGQYEVYAVAFEYAFTDRLSVVAGKDGYIMFRPDNTLNTTEGFANVSAGLKYAWLLDEEKQLASSVSLNFEIPMGHTEVWQGEGDGVFIPSVSTMKNFGCLQLVNQFGFKLPVDNGAESTMFYTSAHVSYELFPWFHPIAEVNYFRVLKAGDGGRRFGEQINGALPSLTTFEAGDLVNWGSGNANINPDFVTGALGFRIVPQCTQLPTSIGFAWEAPLTPTSEGLMDNRFTADFTVQF